MPECCPRSWDHRTRDRSAIASKTLLAVALTLAVFLQLGVDAAKVNEHVVHRFQDSADLESRLTLITGVKGCDLLTHVEFRSNRFPALEGEEKLINPDLWGKQLADFLRDGLRTEGFETTEPIAEDWGWRLNVINDTFALWIGCGHYQEYDDGYLCFIEPHEPFVWKPFRRVGTRDRVAALQQAMNKVLGEDVGIRAMRWWTYEDFNHPSRFTAGPNR